MRLLLLLLLLLRHLLIVLVVGDVVLIATVSGIRIGSVILSVLRAVVIRASACSPGCWCASWAGRRGWLTVSTVSPVRIPVSALSVTTVVLLGRILLEPLVLFADVRQQVFTKFLCILDFVGVGATACLVEGGIRGHGDSRYM